MPQDSVCGVRRGEQVRCRTARKKKYNNPRSVCLLNAESQSHIVLCIIFIKADRLYI